MTTEVQKAGALLGVFQGRSAPVGLHEREVPGLGQPKRTCENRNSNQDVNFNTTKSDRITTHLSQQNFVLLYLYLGGCTRQAACSETPLSGYINTYLCTYINPTYLGKHTLCTRPAVGRGTLVSGYVNPTYLGRHYLWTYINPYVSGKTGSMYQISSRYRDTSIWVY